MISDRTPVNRQAALFLSKKHRADTIEEAMDRFLCRLVDAKTADQIRSVLIDPNLTDPVVSISISIRKDAKERESYTAKLRTNVSLAQNDERLFNLK